MAPKHRDNQNYDGNSCYFDAARGNSSRKSDHRSAVDYWRRGTCTASERPCKWPSVGSSMACCRRRTRHNTNRRIDPVRCEMQRSIGPTLRIFRTQMSSSCGLDFYFCSPIESVSIRCTQSVSEMRSEVESHKDIRSPNHVVVLLATFPPSSSLARIIASSRLTPARVDLLIPTLKYTSIFCPFAFRLFYYVPPILFELFLLTLLRFSFHNFLALFSCAKNNGATLFSARFLPTRACPPPGTAQIYLPS
jgi:hypothetical protein